jgi:8-oxo-dGTP diphosphatase
MTSSSCVYLEREGSWLMLLRNKKKHDLNHGKWIGVGGKLEPQESMEECAIREVYEETGYIIHSLQKAVTVLFCYGDKEREEITVYTSSDFSGKEKICNEGTLAWIPKNDVWKLELWEGDRIFLKKMLSGKELPFSMVLFYDARGNLINVKEGE